MRQNPADPANNLTAAMGMLIRLAPEGAWRYGLYGKMDGISHSESFRDEVPGSSDELLPIVYEELRRLAAFRLKHEAGNKTLQPTALVHEAWIRLASSEVKPWENRAHFFNAAAQAMRRILVDRARAQSRQKRTRPEEHPLGESAGESDAHVLMIHECLTRLEKIDPYSAKVVLLKFYGGLSSEEISGITGRSVRSVERQWMFAKAKLYQMIRDDQSE